MIGGVPPVWLVRSNSSGPGTESKQNETAVQLIAAPPMLLSGLTHSSDC